MTDISGQPVSPIFKLTLENGTKLLSQNVSKELPLCNT